MLAVLRAAHVVGKGRFTHWADPTVINTPQWSEFGSSCTKYPDSIVESLTNLTQLLANTLQF